jgi:hypothetical protein
MRMTGPCNVQLDNVPGPGLEDVAGVPAHEVPPHRVLECQMGLTMTGLGLRRVGDVQVSVPGELKAEGIRQPTKHT